MNFMKTKHNPDILTCLANLSSDEVFTPPKVANEVLDMLPEEIWSDSNATFLDPVSKSGVFLREITKRLIKGLEKEIPDRQKRINHILKNQVFGIAITEITAMLSRRSLYCTKDAGNDYSICQAFNDAGGNIRFKKSKHKWKNGRCVYCGVNKTYKREEGLESHAYEFIHTKKPEVIFNMRFDVIVGNPPYQMSDGGHGASAIPIYHHFVRQAKKLRPRFLSMIIPSRWFSGGRGLDSFRAEMLADKHIRNLVDYESFKDVFPGVDLAGGACYFLWDRDNEGPCTITNNVNGEKFQDVRYLDEYPVFIRSNKAVSIIRKVMSCHNGNYMDKTVYASKPFGLRTFYEPKESGIPCQFIQRIGLKYADPKDVTDSMNLLDKWKLIVPRAPIAGQTDFSKAVKFYYDGNTSIAPPGTCCTESFIVVYAADTEKEIKSFKTYLYTKIVRFLLLQCVVSQDVTREKFKFVPDLGSYKGKYTDEILREKWDITDDEWEFINLRILPTEGGGN